MRKLIIRTTIWLILLGLSCCSVRPGRSAGLKPGSILPGPPPSASAAASGSPATTRPCSTSAWAPSIQRDQKGWDKLFMVTVLVLWFAWFALMGLDVRYHWSDVPLYAQIIGFLLLILGCYLVVADLQGEQLRRAGGQDPEGARAPGHHERTIRLCSPSDVCRRASDQYRRAASARLVVGPRGRCPLHRR